MGIAYIVGTLILFGMQFLFLLGAPHLRWPRPRRKRSIFVSLAAGSLIALLLTVGIVLSLVSLYRLIYVPQSFGVTYATTQPATSLTIDQFIPWIVIVAALGTWAFWFLIFALVGTANWSTRFRWIYRTLIAGTVIELLITIPIDAQVRKRTNCYCGEGTLLSLVIGLTAILWTFGPGVAILFFVRRRQLLTRNVQCITCGYDLRGIESNRCPECGTPFKRTVATPV